MISISPVRTGPNFDIRVIDGRFLFISYSSLFKDLVVVVEEQKSYKTTGNLVKIRLFN